MEITTSHTPTQSRSRTYLTEHQGAELAESNLNIWKFIKDTADQSLLVCWKSGMDVICLTQYLLEQNGKHLKISSIWLQEAHLVRIIRLY